MKEILNFKTKNTNNTQDKIIESVKQKTNRFIQIFNTLNKEKPHKDNVINIKMSAIKFLEKNFDKENNEIKKEVFRRAFLFISRMSATLDQDISSELFTSIFSSQKSNAYKLLSEDFSTFKTKVIDFATFLSENKNIIKSITGMQNGLGIPDLIKLKELLDFCKENQINIQKVTRLQIGIPSLDRLKMMKLSGGLD